MTVGLFDTATTPAAMVRYWKEGHRAQRRGTDIAVGPLHIRGTVAVQTWRDGYRAAEAGLPCTPVYQGEP